MSLSRCNVFRTEDCRGHRESFASCNTDIRRSRRNICAYIIDNEPSDHDGHVAVYVADSPLHRIEMGALGRMTGCLVLLVSYALHAGGVVVAVVLSVIQHYGFHVDVGERMTTKKRPSYIRSKVVVIITLVCRKCIINHKRVVFRVT